MTDTTNDAARGRLTGSAADAYEQMFVPAIFDRWPPVLLDAAGVAPGDRVLDVGCGTGVLAAAASERVGVDGRVVGLDPNEPVLTVARRRPEPIEWRSAAAETIPYADGAFDTVVSQFVLMYLADRGRGLAEMARVTVPGGRVAVATWVALEASPGYAALVDVAGRTVGEEAAAALRAPFCLGDADELRTLVAASYADVEVRRHQGTARFDSIDAMVRAEMCGWTLATAVDDEQYDHLLAAARADLAPLTGPTGSVEFALPALVATGRRT